MSMYIQGNAFAIFGEANIENFHWVKGEDSLKSYQTKNETIRKFCKNCGSSLIFVPSNDKGK